MDWDAIGRNRREAVADIEKELVSTQRDLQASPFGKKKLLLKISTQ